MASALDTLKEYVRQKQTKDTLFYRRLPPIFELRVPKKIAGGGGTSYLFPLPMPPQQQHMTYPFAAEITPTDGSGVVAEENGVVTVEIRLAGTFGQRPKQYRGGYFGAIGLEPSGSAPFTRRMSDHDVGMQTLPGFEITGHRYMQHLKHAVFGLYSDLKQDPELAEETQMILHLPKDGEHYVVIPRNLVVPRDFQKNRLRWDYEITLTGIGAAKKLEEPSEDRPLLTSLLNAVQTVRKALRLIRGAIQDLGRIRAEIEGIARSITGALDDIAGIIEEASAFIDGTETAIKMTRARVEAGADRLEAAIEDFGNLVSDDTAHLLMEVLDGTQELLAHPGVFARPQQDVVADSFRKGMGLLSSRSRNALDAAAAGEPPLTEADLRTAGNLPGDLERDARMRSLPEEFRQYRGAYEVILDEASDESLERLAAIHLGDARRWRHIAILNGLSEPYISDLGLPRTLGTGARILIPATEPNRARSVNPSVLGARPEDSAAVRELGTDWLVVLDPISGLEDWAIDAEGGSVDLRVASGVECLSQDLLARLNTPKGGDVLYKAMGLERIIGIGSQDLEEDATRLRVAEAIEADSRVASTANVEITYPTPDTQAISASVYVKGLREPVSVQVSTPSASAP